MSHFDVLLTDFAATAATRLPRPERHDLNWLGSLERRELARLTNSERREQWLAGRWSAKQLVRRAGIVSKYSQLQVLSRDRNGSGIAPRLLIGGRELRWSLSISHSGSGVLVALAPVAWLSVGVDLAAPATRGPGFARLWFTPDESAWAEADESNRTATLWAIKEAVYKATGGGGPWMPRELEVFARAEGGFDCSHFGQFLLGLSIKVQRVGNEFMAIACLARDTQGHANLLASPVRQYAAGSEVNCSRHVVDTGDAGRPPSFYPIRAPWERCLWGDGKAGAKTGGRESVRARSTAPIRGATQ